MQSSFSSFISIKRILLHTLRMHSFECDARDAREHEQHIETVVQEEVDAVKQKVEHAYAFMAEVRELSGLKLPEALRMQLQL